MNLFTGRDRVLVVNGGSFGRRFVLLCRIHGIPFTEILLPAGMPLTAEALAPYEGAAYTGFLVNLHETSTGVRFDADLISSFCKRNGLFLVVDAISTFLADPFDMQGLGAGVMITSSQKVLACPPGIAALVLSREAVARAGRVQAPCLYLDLRAALEDGERGQTPFTPAVGILLQLHARLQALDKAGGAEAEIRRIASLARGFRRGLEGLPLEIASSCLSNAMTPLHPLHVPAYRVFEHLKDEYGIWVCPNGGLLRDQLFRVGHIGALTEADHSRLLEALADLHRRGLL